MYKNDILHTKSTFEYWQKILRNYSKISEHFKAEIINRLDEELGPFSTSAVQYTVYFGGNL